MLKRDVCCTIWTSGYLTGGISGCLPIVYIAKYTIYVVKCLLSEKRLLIENYLDMFFCKKMSMSALSVVRLHLF